MSHNPRHEMFNFSRYLNLILSEFMGIEIKALFPEWEKPARMDTSYCIIFMYKEGYKVKSKQNLTNCFSNSKN